MSKDKAAALFLKQLGILSSRGIAKVLVKQSQMNLVRGILTERDGKMFYRNVELEVSNAKYGPSTISRQ